MYSGGLYKVISKDVKNYGTKLDLQGTDLLTLKI